MSFGYKINKNLKLTIGANNLFDIYPDLNPGPKTAQRPSGILNGAPNYPNPATTIDLTSSDQFIYSRNVSQFGQNGRFAFARLNFTF